jgi:hypothetical protein
MLSNDPSANDPPARGDEATRAPDGRSAPSEAIAVFEKREQAEAFVDTLAREVDIEGQVVERKSSVGTGFPAAAIFEIQVPAERLFAVETLYRLDTRGIRLDQLPGLPKSERAQVLQDVLCSCAGRSGGWERTPCTPEELAWFQAAAQLSEAHVRWAVSQAREAFFKQSANEQRVARIMGLCCIAAGLALVLFQGPASLGPLILVGTGAAFAIFSFVRRDR